MYDKNRISCKDCIEFKRRQGLEPDCDNCEYSNKVDLLPENGIIDYIMYWYGATFTDGMGGISMSSIKEALVLENIEDKQLITKKLIIYLKAGLDAQYEEKKDGDQEPKIST